MRLTTSVTLALVAVLLFEQPQTNAHSTSSLEQSSLSRRNAHNHNRHHRHPKPSAKGFSKKKSKKPAKNSHPQSNDDDDNDDGDSTGLIHRHYQSCHCPNPHANKNRPNGSIDFLNCGIDGNGWKPPPVQVDHLKMISPREAIKFHIFKPCGQYIDIFEKVEQNSGVPAMILISIAMQESHCDAHLKGPNGEIGMMQLTKENCHEGGHDPGEAWNPHINVKLAASQFQGYLNKAGGNVLAALGQYNGWRIGMTEKQARSEKYGCFAQNNLDYLDSTVNGWLQGKDGYGKEFRTFNNLAHCGDD